MTPSESPAADVNIELRREIYCEAAGNPPYRLTETQALGDGNMQTVTDQQTVHRAEASERYIKTHERNMTAVVP